MQYKNIHIVIQQVDKERCEYRLNGTDIQQRDIDCILKVLEQLTLSRSTEETSSLFFEGSLSSSTAYKSVSCMLSISELYGDIKLYTSCIYDIQSENSADTWHNEVKNTLSKFKSNQAVADYAKQLLVNWIDSLLDDHIEQITEDKGFIWSLEQLESN